MFIYKTTNTTLTIHVSLWTTDAVKQTVRGDERHIVGGTATIANTLANIIKLCMHNKVVKLAMAVKSLFICRGIQFKGTYWVYCAVINSLGDSNQTVGVPMNV